MPDSITKSLAEHWGDTYVFKDGRRKRNASEDAGQSTKNMTENRAVKNDVKVEVVQNQKREIKIVN